ncbi:hypothetical protein PspLS_08663 [Pyricularia sp. CBS 133598]|nr:hypothetical protein PspLS_08663 [Pyricularia sp. CBS 133598]
MSKSGYYHWGFVIYRCTYDDDALWSEFISLLKIQARAELESKWSLNALERHLRWTIIEDRATLDGATEEEVRQHFRLWCEESGATERDGHSAAFPLEELGLPRDREGARYRYCVYVDGDCLWSVRKFLAYDSIVARYVPEYKWQIDGGVVLIDHEYSEPLL